METPLKPKNSYKAISLFFFILAIVATAFAGYLYIFGEEQVELTTAQPRQSGEETQWNSTNLMGAYTFDYPTGWHVSNRWPQDVRQPALVLINPTPINTAPRGGPIAEITITDTSYSDDPIAYFEQKRNELKEYYKGTETVLEGKSGPVYYYKGMNEIYGEKYETEAYLLLLKFDNTTIHAIQVERNPFSTAYSEETHQIALSFGKALTLNNVTKDDLTSKTKEYVQGLFGDPEATLTNAEGKEDVWVYPINPQESSARYFYFRDSKVADTNIDEYTGSLNAESFLNW